MLGKWIEENFVEPSEAEKRKIVITNPSEDLLKQLLGYKEVKTEPAPNYDAETQDLKVVKISETDTEIVNGWEVVNKPIAPDVPEEWYIMQEFNFNRPNITGTDKEQIEQIKDTLIIMNEQLNYTVNQLVKEVNQLEEKINMLGGA